MILHQIQATYQVDDDRILLRVSFAANDGCVQEIRAWLTRRLVKIFWSGIVQALETQVVLDQPHAVHARAEIVSMQHQATVTEIRARGDFDVPFAPDIHSYPFGDQPILLVQAHFSVQAKQTPRINFVSTHNGSFEVAFTAPMLHGLCTLVQDAVKLAEWGFELRLPGIATEQWPDPQRVLN